jgi:UDP-glucose 4-epimerase
LKGEVLSVVAPGTQKRNFTYIDDIIDGLMLVGEKGSGEEYGLGNEREYSVLEIAQMFGTNIEMLPERPGNRMISAIDTTKSRALGWSARRNIGDYIRTIVAEKA